MERNRARRGIDGVLAAKTLRELLQRPEQGEELYSVVRTNCSDSHAGVHCF